ncbi:MAG: DUF58 domain-containing protein [SAR86 cluster bacterium]|uniref:DUF58 domain-containing protein n=1 Tax=SAR86 cluster bacterium TaxID=2030880 RepID=A0A2A5BAX3_9GAMM|nr:MAG: DUF58 domain-containing protein [SAR86 cluster bacterium]
MVFSFREKLNKSYQRWIAKNIPPRAKITLNRRNIFIVPSRNGLFFILACALIFIAAINYAVSLAFGLTFLMASIFILAILHCFNNLNQLTLESRSSLPVFCGDEARFRVLLSRSAKRTHEALELNFPKSPVSNTDLVARDLEEVDVFVLADKRGEFHAPRLRVTTIFPLGLCRAWSVVDLNLSCLVYPKPVAFAMTQFNSGSSGQDDSAMHVSGSEEFYGLRDYVPGDPMRSVAWKNVAKGQGMQVKQFVDYVDNKVWLDWDMFYGFSVEERLSRLCYCVLQLARSGNPFGLKIPGTEISPGTGPEHKRQLLKALALFSVD